MDTGTEHGLAVLLTLGCTGVAEPSLFPAEKSLPATAARMVRTLARLAASIALTASLASCSLISLKSPEKPLSTRDLNARILTREYSARFIAAARLSGSLASRAA